MVFGVGRAIRREPLYLWRNLRGGNPLLYRIDWLARAAADAKAINYRARSVRGQLFCLSLCLFSDCRAEYPAVGVGVYRRVDRLRNLVNLA